MTEKGVETITDQTKKKIPPHQDAPRPFNPKETGNKADQREVNIDLAKDQALEDALEPEDVPNNND